MKYRVYMVYKEYKDYKEFIGSIPHHMYYTVCTIQSHFTFLFLNARIKDHTIFYLLTIFCTVSSPPTSLVLYSYCT